MAAELVIIGSGPAGLTAGIYAARAGVVPIVLEGLDSGGQLLTTQHVANYPGYPDVVPGRTIIDAMRRQAESAGVKFVMDVVKSVDFTGEPKKLATLMGDTLEARAVIIASGAGVTKTNLPGEARFWGRGISACLTCDGAFYVAKPVVIVGEGPAALGARNYLEKLGAQVVALLAPADVAEFRGDLRHLTGVATKAGATIACEGAFLVTARRPQTDFLGSAVAKDALGHVLADHSRTSVPGVFAAGDCAEPEHKQAVVAAGDGAVAALEALRWLRG